MLKTGTKILVFDNHYMDLPYVLNQERQHLLNQLNLDFHDYLSTFFMKTFDMLNEHQLELLGPHRFNMSYFNQLLYTQQLNLDYHFDDIFQTLFECVELRIDNDDFFNSENPQFEQYDYNLSRLAEFILHQLIERIDRFRYYYQPVNHVLSGIECYPYSFRITIERSLPHNLRFKHDYDY